MSRKGSLNTVHPFQRHLLPERDVPQFFVDRVGSKLQCLMREIVRNALKDVAGALLRCRQPELALIRSP